LAHLRSRQGIGKKNQYSFYQEEEGEEGKPKGEVAKPSSGKSNSKKKGDFFLEKEKLPSLRVHNGSRGSTGKEGRERGETSGKKREKSPDEKKSDVGKRSP